MRQLLVGAARGCGLVVLALSAACADAPEVAGGGPPEEVTYAQELGVDLDAMEETPTGLYRQDVRAGTGEVATAGDRVSVHYTGWLPNGVEFDSSRGGQPFDFTLGAGEVIPGWEEGVEGMRVGGVRRLVIPSELAYGPTGAGGVIPPDATLVFEVELLGIQ